MDITHGKYLGVDYGDKRTGLAECDISGMLASGITTVKEGGLRNTAVRVAKEAEDRSCKKIISGLSKNMDGTEGARAQLCRDFARLLEEATGIPVTMWDERRTTVEAHNILSEHNYHGKKRKDTVDAVAASLILEGYLASRPK